MATCHILARKTSRSDKNEAIDWVTTYDIFFVDT